MGRLLGGHRLVDQSGVGVGQDLGRQLSFAVEDLRGRRELPPGDGAIFGAVIRPSKKPPASRIRMPSCVSNPIHALRLLAGCCRRTRVGGGSEGGDFAAGPSGPATGPASPSGGPAAAGVRGAGTGIAFVAIDAADDEPAEGDSILPSLSWRWNFFFSFGMSPRWPGGSGAASPLDWVRIQARKIAESRGAASRGSFLSRC